MRDFLFTNNNLSNKTKSINKTINNSTKKRGTIINKLVARKICYHFKNNIPFTMKNGIQISFNDCNTLKDAIIKYSGIISRMKAQKQKIIRINGKSFQPMTNDSFIKSIDSSFSDHFEMYCIVNNVNGKYNSNN